MTWHWHPVPYVTDGSWSIGLLILNALIYCAAFLVVAQVGTWTGRALRAVWLAVRDGFRTGYQRHR